VIIWQAALARDRLFESVQMPRRPRQTVGTATHVEPWQRVCEDVGGRARAGFPERHQLLAIGRPVVSHVVAEEGRQLRP
jgi:hypothetical protein